MSGNIHAAVLVIAEKVSDHMLDKPYLAPATGADGEENSMATQLGDGFDVGGIRLDRPFKIRRLGHFGFNSRNMNAAMHFYRDLLGFQSHGYS